MEHPRVAIVEDHDDTRAMYCELLTTCGFDVVPLATGADLLQFLKRAYLPDAILMDLGLPDAEGVQLCRVIRADERFRTLPILAVTGWSSGEHVRGLGDAPFNEVFLKPVDAEMLVEALRRWIHLWTPGTPRPVHSRE